MNHPVTKPPVCKCGFAFGHAIDCPSYDRWCREIGDNPTPTSPPAESKPAPAIEDRGTAAWVFEGGGEASFCSFAGWERRHEISVPIGWSFIPHESGVLIANRFRVGLTAERALDYARGQRDGFRVRKIWNPYED